MIEKIVKEIDNYCKKCDKECIKQECVIYRIKMLCGYFFECENANIDYFFDKEKSTQTSLFETLDKE